MTTPATGQQEGTLANPCSACHGCGWDNPAQAIDRCRHCGGNGMEPNAEDQPSKGGDCHRPDDTITVDDSKTGAAHPPNADHAGRSTDAGVSSSNPGAQARCRPGPNADRPSADALSADDHRLLAMLRGEWNNEADGYWPAVDAMDEAARVIDRLAARLAEAQKDAERYRWLRDKRNNEQCSVSLTDYNEDEQGTEYTYTGAALDAAIDAAMWEGK